jgi:hypothetical protein
MSYINNKAFGVRHIYRTCVCIVLQGGTDKQLKCTMSNAESLLRVCVKQAKSNPTTGPGRP